MSQGQPSRMPADIAGPAQIAYETFCKETGSDVSWWTLNQVARDAWTSVANKLLTYRCKWCGAARS